MDYQAELDFMIRALRRLRLQVHLLKAGESLEVLDFGFRAMLGMQEDYENAASVFSRWSNQKTVYKVLDQFMCSFIYFLLPGTAPITAMVIGPYLTVDPSREQIMEKMEQLGIPMRLLQQQVDFYASLPVYNDPSVIMALVNTFGEILWGSAEAFDTVDVNLAQRPGFPPAFADNISVEQIDILTQMKQMEERYAYENEMMEVVSKGLTQQADVMMSSVSKLNFQQRTADPLRNMKNYCIICNTIMRKAAEQGGVHPLHLDRMSSRYARAIEEAPTLNAGYALIGEMLRSYSRLVRTQAIRHYSAIVQKALTYIEANLSGDLSLQTIADTQQVTPGYLSALFRKETGRTLTEHVTEQRMKAALQLLKRTRLQVQTIAQLCGFADPNYFSKQFKRYYSVTPVRFRKDFTWYGSQGEQ